MDSSQEEVIYGADPAESIHEGVTDSQNVMSEKVENLAREIYAEFEKMMEKYGQEVVKNLMPLVVNVLENLDIAGIENQEHQVELELIKEDNEQLATQYEREKCLRRAAEQRLIELEFASEEEKTELQSKVESLGSISRMLELKAKTSADHASRLEEKENEMKKEYSKLHDRYTDLFKTHVDYVEKTKIFFGASQTQTTRQSPEGGAIPIFGATSDIRSPEELHRIWTLDHFSPEKDLSMSEALQSQQEVLSSTEADSIQVRRPNTLYQECQFSDKEDSQKRGDDAVQGPAVTGLLVDPAEFASTVGDNIFGMGKEVENIILENIELLATKNALNIVKDDLIARVDQLSSDRDILEEKWKLSESQKSSYKERAEHLEAELRKSKEATDRQGPEDEESSVPMSHRRRFTRVEMARVLMERNQYKEKLMELQEAVRWSETLKATKITERQIDGEKTGGIFKFFSNLFNTEKQRVPGSFMDVKHSEPKSSSLHAIKLRDGITERRAKQRRDQLKKVKAHVSKDDIGRVQAYGWSLPTANGQNSMNSVPVPVFCRPLDQADPNPQAKVWCASGVHLSSSKPKELFDDPTADMSSLIWICSGIPTRHSKITVIDANNPAEVLDTFQIGTSLILCVQSVPGVRENDTMPDSAYLEKCLSGRRGGNDDRKPQQGLNEISDIVSQPSEKMEEGQTAEQTEGTEAGSTPSESVTQESDSHPEGGEKMSTRLPTMWMGAQNGDLYIHSSKADWKTCIQKVRLSDSVLSIIHHRGRVFCSLANGRITVFHRDPVSQEFNFEDFREEIICDGASIRCLSVVHDDSIWCGYRNCMTVIGTQSLEIEKTFSVHPRKESQVRQMVVVGDGVWITIRLDSTFRLYHAKTHQHLQDVDIEPMISRMIGSGKLGFSFVRITCIGTSCNRLWVGTGNGVILSLPLRGSPAAPEARIEPAEAILEAVTPEITEPQNVAEEIEQKEGLGVARPGLSVRVDEGNIPYCNITEAQLSFHGHKDSVRFILGVPGTGGMISTTSPQSNTQGVTTPPARCMFVLSGGEGYIDLRIGEEAGGCENFSDKSDLSHLIVWEVAL